MDAEPQPPETTEGKGLSERTGVRDERDVRPDVGHADTHPRPRADSYHSARSISREDRMLALEETMLRMEDVVQRMHQALEAGGLRSPELRGPPPKTRPDYVEYPYDRHPSHRRQSSPYQGASSKFYPKGSTQAGPDPQGGPKGTTLSPAYQIPEEGIWNQSYLAKALQSMKDTEIAKLRFTTGCSKPLEYEKWVTLMGTTMNGHHTEIGLYWQRVVASAEKAYSSYIKDVSYTRISIFPEEKLPRTMIEERIE